MLQLLKNRSFLLTRMNAEQQHIQQVLSAWTVFLNRQLSSLQQQDAAKKEPAKLENNPYYNKYAEKLKKVQSDPSKPTSDDGFKTNAADLTQLTDEQKLVSAKLNQLEARLDKDSDSGASGNNKSDASSASASHAATTSKPHSSYVKSKKLDDLVRLDLLQKHTPDEIRDIWSQYFRNKNACLFACIEKATYERLQMNAHRFPTFVFPLPVIGHKSATQSDADASKQQQSKTSYQFVLSQFNGDQVYFTPLIMYQAKGADAPACLTISHFTELADSKGLVLMEGEYDDKVFNSFEAQCLANQIQIFYATDASNDGDGGSARTQAQERRLRLLETFNKQPGNFNYMDIIHEFEHLSILPKK